MSGNAADSKILLDFLVLASLILNFNLWQGEKLTLFYNPAKKLVPNDEFGIAFNGIIFHVLYKSTLFGHALLCKIPLSDMIGLNVSRRF